MAILRKRIQHDHIEINDETALEEISRRITSNVRALEGALIRTVAFSSLTGRPITTDLTREVLDNLYPDTPTPGKRERTVDEIQAATCEHFGLSPAELLSSARARRITWPRQVAMYLSRELTNESLPAIGRQFGGRDHTTVLHAWRRTSAKIAADQTSREAVEDLCKTLHPEHPARHAPADRSS
jgi:chromosomal replication initiator protein